MFMFSSTLFDLAGLSLSVAAEQIKSSTVPFQTSGSDKAVSLQPTMWTVHLSPFATVILCILQIATGTLPSFISPKKMARREIPPPTTQSYSDNSETSVLT
ncbi:hypothetical protein B0H14DRAFT_1092323 [Mycena olivaceomarginata]|nr:hypothetical protein B0H14DRAFT_1092323 [Mycena olivaceomarginata]